ncbi:MAG: hypothetical protein ACOYL6_14030 [Bacteriovoracaceae bacterium]
MPLSLTVYGKASGKSWTLTVSDSEQNMTLMDFLISRDIRIASSCSGEGFCKKCMVNEDLISCQITVTKFLDFNQVVSVGYL